MAATDPRHRIGQDVSTVDQLSSVVILGLAVAGGAAAIVLSLLLIG
ncbi:MFS transporter [Methylorubrum aminovorans]